MSESNSDVTDEGKKEHKGDEGESRIISGTMDIEHKGKGVMSESNSDVTDEGKKEHKGERERAG